MPNKKNTKLTIYYKKSKTLNLIMNNNIPPLNLKLIRPNIVYDSTCPVENYILEKKDETRNNYFGQMPLSYLED